MDCRKEQDYTNTKKPKLGNSGGYNIWQPLKSCLYEMGMMGAFRYILSDSTLLQEVKTVYIL